jgi:hypothetical protein
MFLSHCTDDYLILEIHKHNSSPVRCLIQNEYSYKIFYRCQTFSKKKRKLKNRIYGSTHYGAHNLIMLL